MIVSMKGAGQNLNIDSSQRESNQPFRAAHYSAGLDGWEPSTNTYHDSQRESNQLFGDDACACSAGQLPGC